MEWIETNFDSIVKFIVSIHSDLYDRSLVMWDACKTDYAQSLILPVA